MAMEKYGVSQAQTDELLRLKLAKTRQEALEKVASGKADGMIKEAQKGGKKESDDT